MIHGLGKVNLLRVLWFIVTSRLVIDFQVRILWTAYSGDHVPYNEP